MIDIIPATIVSVITALIAFAMGYRSGRRDIDDRSWKRGYLDCHRARIKFEDERRAETPEQFVQRTFDDIANNRPRGEALDRWAEQQVDPHYDTNFIPSGASTDAVVLPSIPVGTQKD